MNASAPPLPPELLRVTQRLRMPYLRRHAPEVIAVAKAQRWDPAEVVRVLLEEEVKGRDDATRRNRRKAAGFPPARLSRLGLPRLHRFRFPPRTG